MHGPTVAAVCPAARPLDVAAVVPRPPELGFLCTPERLTTEYEDLATIAAVRGIRILPQAAHNDHLATRLRVRGRLPSLHDHVAPVA